ncbi:TadE/TadG family type IV pilus assembly protein [Streptomyces sp. NPDC008001]|uniref:TadE/TadG family type IV pilus assembly protein n=1 Tax=Streptomyces sp. NPDC008001 TaxID=3364804 RepID=UPI0036E0EC7D
MTVPRARLAVRTRGDHGQVSVEFLGILPLIILVLLALWECALAGYTYTLAGDAADKGARRGAVATAGRESGACRDAALKSLSGDWRDSASVTCHDDFGTGLYRAKVELEVPVIFPGLGGFPFTVTGEAAAAREG